MSNHPKCVFCQIIRGKLPARIVAEWPETLAIVPLNPVIEGHIIVIPKEHVSDAAEDVDVTAITMKRASSLAMTDSNIITSIGAAATQTVFHLHVHVIPRKDGDGLQLPWSNQHGE